MGFILDQTDKMKPYMVEVRNESFYLHHNYSDPVGRIFAYRSDKDPGHDTVELLLDDIPQLRTCFDEIEKLQRERGETPRGSYCCACGQALNGYHIAWLIDGGPLCRACDPLAPPL